MAAKTDMERIGLFSEMTYVTVGDRFNSKHDVLAPFNVSASKGKQMLLGGNKERSATQAGYFEPTFKRVFESEAYRDVIRSRRLERIQESKKNVGKTFVPSSAEKTPNGVGMYYGTFSGPYTAFSPVRKNFGPYKSPGKNFLTNPGKKGTGYGYAHLIIGKEFEHKDEEYSRSKDLQSKALKDHAAKLRAGPFKRSTHPLKYFEENPYKSDRDPGPAKKKLGQQKFLHGPFKPSSPPKQIGGMKAGTFSHYPTHSADPYALIRNTKKTKKIFVPNHHLKSRPITSIVSYNVSR